MPTALVYSEGQGRTNELINRLLNLKDWDFHSFGLKEYPAHFNDIFQHHIDPHFLIYNRQLNKGSIQELARTRKLIPFTSIVYYYSNLLNQQYLILAQYEVNACIVGKQRQKYLVELLPRLWEKHWKRIPSWIYPEDRLSLNPWAKKVLVFIENHTLDLCNLKNLSKYFDLSESHFRSEFKSNLGVNFREFKQNLFIHYETKLLVEKKYKPSDVYKLLNYSNLANFSRSFKTRHGDSWRNTNLGDENISH